MSDDLLERARFVVQLFRECDAIQLPHGPTEQVLTGMIDSVEELEAKLAQQDDLVQAAVAAKLREAAEEASGGIHTHKIAQAILALITPDAQAALDRYVKERSDEVVAAQQGARPIWTAPRDGTRILIAPYGNPTDLQVSWFIEGEDRWANWSWSVEPSHWFPLPVIRKGGE